MLSIPPGVYNDGRLPPDLSASLQGSSCRSPGVCARQTKKVVVSFHLMLNWLRVDYKCVPTCVNQAFDALLNFKN